jgi:hypothetical protein
MLYPANMLWRFHLPPMTEYPWISILGSETASAVMVMRGTREAIAEYLSAEFS